jgi:hypothetical protein
VPTTPSRNRNTPQRRSTDVAKSRWSFVPSISIDSIIIILSTVVSISAFVFTMNNKIEQQAREIEHVKETTATAIANVQKSVDRQEVDQKERTTRLALDAAERATRLELAIKEQHALVQSMLVPRLQR